MKKNIIKAICKSSIYKDKQIKIKIEPEPEKCRVYVGKEDISSRVMSAHIHVRSGKFTEVVLMLVNTDGL